MKNIKLDSEKDTENNNSNSKDENISQTKTQGYSNAIWKSNFSKNIINKKEIYPLVILTVSLIAINSYIIIDKLFIRKIVVNENIVYFVLNTVMIIVLIGMIKRTIKCIEFYDGVIVGLEIEDDHKISIENNIYTPKDTYIIYVKNENSVIYKNIVNNERYFSYFTVGDKVRYHKILNFLEKQDKSSDDYIYCPFCKNFEEISKTVCGHCGNLLLK